MHLALSHCQVQPVKGGHGPESLDYTGHLHNARHTKHATLASQSCEASDVSDGGHGESARERLGRFRADPATR